MMRQKEVTLMELATEIYNKGDALETEVIDFAVGDAEEVEQYGGWCGIRKVHDYFDADVPMYLIGHYGSEITLMYSISEYDHRIGEKVDKLMRDGYTLTPEATVACIAEMITDYFSMEFGEAEIDVITMEVE